MTIPKSKSLWPSIPRNVTWDRSGSFKPASPPASWARAEAAVSSVKTAAATPNLVSLELRDRAFASQVRIRNPPCINRLSGKNFPGESIPAHSLDRAPRSAQPHIELFSFYREEAAARRFEITPKYGRRSTLKTESKGWHRTQIYNI